ncbi:MAG: hypothetical protein ACXAEU_00575 [Candidatus Hodarchaeales archaeon]|jgi:hypothetical protein
MKVTYRHYEPDKGLEELQARIYNDMLRRNPGTAFAAVTAEQIKKRFIGENKGPEGAKYALKEDGSPLAYIQTSMGGNPTQTWIGYPWAMEDCPAEVQEKLFEEMLEYNREKYPDNEIVMGYLSGSWKKQVAFAKSKGFVVSDTAYFHELDPEEIDREPDQEYTTRIANQDDLDILVELSRADPELNAEFPSDEARIGYFKGRVLADGHAVLVFKDDQLVCASAPLRGFYTGIFPRFAGIRPGHEKTWRKLLIEMAVHCKEQGWKEPLLLTSFVKWKLTESIVKELGASLVDTQILFSLKKE